MQNAINVVFPTTHHRWCLWHIMKKIAEKLSGYGDYKRIKFGMKEVVYDTFTIDDFEEKLCSFIEKFELQQNHWLRGLYNERHRWAPTLLRKYFGPICQQLSKVRLYMLALMVISIQRQV
jgi:hypothetical protein